MLEAGGVDNWDWYDKSLKPWFAKQERKVLFQRVLEDINELLAEADVSEPAGPGCGHAIAYDEEAMIRLFEETLKKAREIDEG